MTPKEFDLDFDFDKDFGFSGDSAAESENSDDFDLDAALARELGPDFDAKFEEEYAAAQAALNAELPPIRIPAGEGPRTHRFARESEEPCIQEPADEPAVELNLEEIPAPVAAVLPEETEEAAVDAVENPEYQETAAAEPEPIPQEDLEAIFAAVSAAQAAAGIEDPKRLPRKERTRREPKKMSLKKPDFKAMAGKIDTAAIREKTGVVGEIAADNAKRFVAALKECKLGKMDKKQKRLFKNDVLPILIGGAAFVLCLVFMFGSLGRVLNSDERKQAALEASIAQAEAEAAETAAIQDTLEKSARQAAQYDYQGAIATLDAYKNEGRKLTTEMQKAKEAYTAAMAELVIWDDPTAITNLSFHALIEDTERAYADSAYAKSYRTKFISTAEFSAILEELYDNGYVLVNLDSCITATTDASGKTTYAAKPIYLPQGKTPIMITETLVNYFAYMVDGDGDGQPDANGDGFANRLVIKSGEIKAEYIDAAGNTLVGDYDLVPILDTFIKNHPDFSYRGAKAILAVTGEEGVFGWRINGDGDQAAGARDVVEVLRATGYQIACNTYGNLDYGTTSTTSITADLEAWNTEIAPVLDHVDIMVIGKGGNVEVPKTLEGSNSRFALIHEAGFHYIIGTSSKPDAKLTADYFYQSRLMVVGSELDSGAYDAYFGFTAETEE